MTHATALRIALPCALLSLTMACTGANTKPDPQLAEDVEPAPPEDVATPEAPPSFCEDPEAREMTVREYRWCARGEVPHGRYVAERDGVTLLEGQFVEGVMEGEWIGYHADGSKKWRGTFAGGKESGEFVAWREDGTKHYSVAFTEGVHEGPTVYFHPTGEKSSEVTFANNAPIR